MRIVSFCMFCILVMFFAVGCEVPTVYKQDAIDISGKYELVEQKVTFGPKVLSPKDTFDIENETAVYDVNMRLRRSEFHKLETRLFDAVTVASEKKYLLERILFGAGYREIDSGDLFESRENLSKDGGKTGQITINSRFFKLTREGVHRDFLTKGDDTQAYCCKSSVTSHKKGVTISIECPEKNIQTGKQCSADAEEGDIFFQAFRYTFKGETRAGSNEIKGLMSLEVRSLAKLSKTESINITKPLWSTEVTLRFAGKIAYK